MAWRGLGIRYSSDFRMNWLNNLHIYSLCEKFCNYTCVSSHHCYSWLLITGTLLLHDICRSINIFICGLNFFLSISSIQNLVPKHLNIPQVCLFTERLMPWRICSGVQAVSIRKFISYF